MNTGATLRRLNAFGLMSNWPQIVSPSKTGMRGIPEATALPNEQPVLDSRFLESDGESGATLTNVRQQFLGD